MNASFDKSGLVLNSIFAFAATCVRGLGAVGVSLFVANGFTPAEFGDFRFFQLTTVVLSVIAAPGIVAVSTKFFATATAGQQEETPPLAHLWLVSFLLAICIGMLCLFLPPFISGIGDTQQKLFLASIVFIASANFLPMGAMIGMNLFFYTLIVEVISFLVLALITIYAIWSNSLSLIIWGLLISTALAFILNSGITIISIGWSRLRASFSAQDFRSALRQVAKTFGPLSLSGIFIAATFWTVGWLTRTSHHDLLIFALFSIGMQWFVLANLVPDVFGRVIFPMTVQIEGNDTRGRQKTLMLSIYVAVGASILTAVGSLIVSPFIMPLYGAEFANSPFLISAYAAAAIPYGVANMIAYALVAKHRERSVMIMMLLQLACASGSAYLLTSFDEYSGAIALFLGATAALLYSTYIAWRIDLFNASSTNLMGADII